MIEIPEAAKNHFDSIGESLQKHFVQTTAVDESLANIEGSFAQKRPLATLDSVEEIALIAKFGRYAVQRKNLTIGFPTRDGQEQFGNLIDQLCKRKELSNYCSNSLIQDTAFNWFLGKFDGKVSQDFSSYVVEVLNGKCTILLFFFPILFLEIEEPFNIGNVSIDFFTDDIIDGFAKSNLILAKDLDRFKNEYSGKVYASISIEGLDETKAEELALNGCAFALNILKMYSQTVIHPKVRCNFGLESMVNFNPSSNPISIELEEQGDLINAKKMAVLMRVHATPYFLTKKHLTYMNENGLPRVSNFLKQPPNNELAELILQAIDLYGEAISNKNIHKRIVDLFTIVESFLVKNESEPIINSITKYFPKIVSKTAEDRKVVIEVLKALYAIRSAMIHHGVHKEINFDNLSMLQESIRVFILNMIFHCRMHETKYRLLNEIDDAINEAY